MSSLLRLENVSKVYHNGKSNRCVALDNISLEIRRGEYITVWGGNGAGKTSLQDAIARGNVSNGRIFFNNENITKMPEHKRSRFIARITQNPFDILAESLTLEENLRVASLRAKRRKLRKAITSDFRTEIRDKVSELGLGLEDRLQENVTNLSGGERQALTLLMVTFSIPEILLLDEHTAALDLEKTKLIESLTDSIIKENHITTLWITHNKEQAARFGDRILFMRKGEIVKNLSGEERQNLQNAELIELLERFQNESDSLTSESENVTSPSGWK